MKIAQMPLHISLLELAAVMLWIRRPLQDVFYVNLRMQTADSPPPQSERTVPYILPDMCHNATTSSGTVALYIYIVYIVYSDSI